VNDAPCRIARRGDRPRRQRADRQCPRQRQRPIGRPRLVSHAVRGRRQQPSPRARLPTLPGIGTPRPSTPTARSPSRRPRTTTAQWPRRDLHRHRRLAELDVRTLRLTVSAVNDAPVANNGHRVHRRSTPLPPIAVLANDTDVDGDLLSVTGATLANSALGTVVGEPRRARSPSPLPRISAAARVVNYTISDGHGGTDDRIGDRQTWGANTPPTGADSTPRSG